jgi:hypothetical protein
MNGFAVSKGSCYTFVLCSLRAATTAIITTAIQGRGGRTRNGTISRSDSNEARRTSGGLFDLLRSNDGP